MTDHDDFDARLARLEAATKGDTVTIPDGWEKPADPELSLRASRADLRPGDVFTNDGTGVMEWALDTSARHRDGNVIWYTSRTLAWLGLEPDRTRTPDVDAGPRVSVSESVPEGIAIIGDFSEEPETTTRGEKARAARSADDIGWVCEDGIMFDPATVTKYEEKCCGCAECARLCGGCDACTPDADDETQDEDGESTSIGSVTLTVTPDTAAFEARLDELSVQAEGLAARIATLPETYELDEYQRERVAALEQGLRVLESRRGPVGEPTGLVGFVGVSHRVGRVTARDLVNVAAFIANGDVIPPEVKA